MPLQPASREMPDLKALRIGDSLSIHRLEGQSYFVGVATVIQLPSRLPGRPGNPRKQPLIGLRGRTYRIRADGFLQRVPNHEPTVMYVRARYGD